MLHIFRGLFGFLGEELPDYLGIVVLLSLPKCHVLRSSQESWELCSDMSGLLPHYIRPGRCHPISGGEKLPVTYWVIMEDQAVMWKEPRLCT